LILLVSSAYTIGLIVPGVVVIAAVVAGPLFTAGGFNPNMEDLLTGAACSCGELPPPLFFEDDSATVSGGCSNSHEIMASTSLPQIDRASKLNDSENPMATTWAMMASQPGGMDGEAFVGVSTAATVGKVLGGVLGVVEVLVVVVGDLDGAERFSAASSDRDWDASSSTLVLLLLAFPSPRLFFFFFLPFIFSSSSCRLFSSSSSCFFRSLSCFSLNSLCFLSSSSRSTFSFCCSFNASSLSFSSFCCRSFSSFCCLTLSTAATAFASTLHVASRSFLFFASKVLSPNNLLTNSRHVSTFPTDSDGGSEGIATRAPWSIRTLTKSRYPPAAA